MIPVQEVAEIVGTAAGVATITATVVKLTYSHREKKRRVTVKLSHGTPVYAHGLGRDVLLVEAMNPGSLPVTPTSFGILRPNGSTIISRQNDCSAELPYELPAGKNLIKWLEMVPVAQSLSRAGYGGKVNLVGFYRDALDAWHKSKPLEVDVAMWLRLAISAGFSVR